MNSSIIIIIWVVCVTIVVALAGIRICTYLTKLAKKYADDVDERNVQYNKHVRFIETNLR